jgi:hypothetical protein
VAFSGGGPRRDEASGRLCQDPRCACCYNSASRRQAAAARRCDRVLRASAELSEAAQGLAEAQARFFAAQTDVARAREDAAGLRL